MARRQEEVDKQADLRTPVLESHDLTRVPSLRPQHVPQRQTGGGGATGPHLQKPPPECHAAGVRGTPHHPACTDTNINIH